MSKNRHNCPSYDRKNLFDAHPADEIRDSAKKTRDRKRDPQRGAHFVAKRVMNDHAYLVRVAAGVHLDL